MQQRFEHEVFLTDVDSAESADEKLRELQVDGWELVTVIAHGSYYALFMKRLFLASHSGAFEHAPKNPTHVSTDGVVRIPKRVLQALALPNGGTVSFVDREDGVVEMMSTATFLERAGVDDDAT